MLSKILHALIESANVGDNLRGELHALADEVDSLLAKAIAVWEAPPQDAPAVGDVSRETLPPEAAPPAEAEAPGDDVSRETVPAEAPADDASGA